MTPRTEIDRDKLRAYVKRVGSSVTAGYNCAISSLGDRLGLYRALRELRIASSEELAHHTGLNERWIREWLRHQACVEQVEYDAETDRFWLSPKAIAVLLDDTMPTYLAGGFDGVVATMPSLPGLVERFRTGVGRSYDDHGAGCACGIERLSSHGKKFQLVPNILPLLDGVVERLESASVSPTSVAAAHWQPSRWRKRFRVRPSSATTTPRMHSNARAPMRDRQACRTSSSSIPTSARCRISQRST